MNNSVVVDSNLLLLLIVETASREYIAKHKKLAEYSDGDLDLLTLLITQFSDMDTSNNSRCWADWTISAMFG
jgi:hypothetical protein